MCVPNSFAIINALRHDLLERRGNLRHWCLSSSSALSIYLFYVVFIRNLIFPAPQVLTMVLEDVTNLHRSAGSYTTSTVLLAKYRPCIYRGQPLDKQTPRSQFPAERKAGDTNIDIWLDGSIYLENPRTRAPPPFCDLKTLLCFLGDGAEGLLGYTNSLQCGAEYATRCVELISLVGSLDEEMRRLQTQFDVERNALLVSRVQDRKLYEVHVSTQLAHFHEAAVGHEAQLRLQQDAIATHVAEKVQHIKEATQEVNSLIQIYTLELQRLRDNYEVQLHDLKLKLLTTQSLLTECRLKCSKLIETPMGLRRSGRKKKDLSSLKKSGGRAKRVKAAVR